MASPRRRKSTASQDSQAFADPTGLSSFYGDPPTTEESKTARVTVSVHPGLLRYIDDYIEWHPETNRSAIFDQAIEIWIRWMQTNNEKRNAQREKTEEELAWKEIQTEAAKFIWP